MKSLASDGSARPDRTIKAAAQAWVLRHDRGLTPAETEEFNTWLEADPKHAEAWEQSSGIWSQLDLLSANAAEFTAPARARRPWAGWMAGAAAAAAIAVAYFGWWAPGAQSSAASSPAIIASAETRVVNLADGTTVTLKAGSELAERFTPEERRVVLVRGEARFEVTKNKARPFVVRAGTVEVRAVGTAFNVQLQPAAVEVRVTEGQVRVSPDQPAGTVVSASGQPLVSAGERAVVDLAPNAPAKVQVFPMDAGQMTAAQAMEDPLLRLGGSTLEELAAEFQRRNGRLIIIADPELKKIQVGGQIRGDNLDGFVRLLEDNYGIKSERSSDGNIILRKAP